MRVDIYGKETGCGFCEAAKIFCDMNGIKYTFHVVNATKLKVLENCTGREMRTVPQIFVDGEYVGGYRDFRKHAKLLLG